MIHPCPYMSDGEIADICAPLVMPAAQVRFLKRMGMCVFRKPNGRPLLARAEFERVAVGGKSRDAESREPNRQALLQLVGKGKRLGPAA